MIEHAEQARKAHERQTNVTASGIVDVNAHSFARDLCQVGGADDLRQGLLQGCQPLRCKLLRTDGYLHDEIDALDFMAAAPSIRLDGKAA